MATLASKSRTPSPHTLLPMSPVLRQGRTLVRLGLALLALGVVCRAVRYGMQFPYFGDEGMLAVNFLDRDYFGLTKTLDNIQVAPLLFLWGEKTALILLGGAEWSMRLLPFLASLGGLLLFWRLARLLLTPRAALIAVGLLAVARWPVTMGAVVKPYSFDLFFSLVLLVPAVQWLLRPDRLRWLVLLAALVPVALLASYPSVFVAGAISLALLPAVWQNRRASVLAAYAVYNVLMFATFFGAVLFIGHEQQDPVAGTVGTSMRTYWADGFPPAQPWAFVRWFVAINTGRIMAYPVGESNGGSALTVLLFLVGAWRFWREGRRALLVLCLTPFVLNFVAAVLDRYPYGACCRLSQHLAPAICLLAGCGAASLVERFLAPAARRRTTYLLCGLLGVCGVAQLFIDVGHPYRDDEGRWTRRLSDEMATLASPNDRIVVQEVGPGYWPLLRWQLQRRKLNVVWNKQMDAQQMDATGGRVWLLSLYWQRRPEGDATPAVLRDNPNWVRVDEAHFTLRRRAEDGNEACVLTCWERVERAKTAPRPVISCWP